MIWYKKGLPSREALLQDEKEGYLTRTWTARTTTRQR